MLITLVRGGEVHVRRPEREEAGSIVRDIGVAVELIGRRGTREEGPEMG